LYRAQVERQNLEPRDRKLSFGMQPYFNTLREGVCKKQPPPLPTRQYPFIIRVLNALLFDNSKLGTVGI